MHLNLSAIKNSTLAGKLLRLPLRLLPSNAVVPILQGPLARQRWIVGASTHGCWLGSYEYDKQKRFAEHAAAARVVYDVGAHVGFYTLLASTSVGTEGRVFAFEPAPRNLTFLNEHVRLNNRVNVTVFPYAVSDRKGTLRFDSGQHSSMGYLAEHGSQTVAVVALDDLVASGTILAPDLMKIDVEGEEARVLAGAERTITGARPVIFLATHSAGLHRFCVDWLEAKGYQVAILAADEILAAPRAL